MNYEIEVCACKQPDCPAGPDLPTDLDGAIDYFRKGDTVRQILEDGTVARFLLVKEETHHALFTDFGDGFMEDFRGTELNCVARVTWLLDPSELFAPDPPHPEIGAVQDPESIVMRGMTGLLNKYSAPRAALLFVFLAAFCLWASLVAIIRPAYKWLTEGDGA